MYLEICMIRTFNLQQDIDDIVSQSIRRMSRFLKLQVTFCLTAELSETSSKIISYRSESEHGKYFCRLLGLDQSNRFHLKLKEIH